MLLCEVRRADVRGVCGPQEGETMTRTQEKDSPRGEKDFCNLSMFGTSLALYKKLHKGQTNKLSPSF
jgi:hypothetical protein